MTKTVRGFQAATVRAALFVCLVFMAVASNAMPITFATSTFDDPLLGTDGWTILEPGVDPAVGFDFFDQVATGGNPVGYLRTVDLPGSQAPTSLFALAPDKFLGDWSGMDEVGRFSFDYQDFDGEFLTGDDPLFFIADSSGNSASVRFAPTVLQAWETISVDIAESAWIVDGDWDTLLSDVTLLGIRIDQTGGGTMVGGDVVGLDNITVAKVAEPGSIVLIGLGLVGLGLMKRRRTA